MQLAGELGPQWASIINHKWHLENEDRPPLNWKISLLSLTSPVCIYSITKITRYKIACNKTMDYNTHPAHPSINQFHTHTTVHGKVAWEKLPFSSVNDFKRKSNLNSFY